MLILISGRANNPGYRDESPLSRGLARYSYCRYCFVLGLTVQSPSIVNRFGTRLRGCRLRGCAGDHGTEILQQPVTR